MLTSPLVSLLFTLSQSADGSASQGWYVVGHDQIAYRQLKDLPTWKERDAKAAELGLIQWDGSCRYYISPALTGDLAVQLNSRLLQYLTANSAWDRPVSKATHDPSEFSAFRSIFERAFSSAYTSEPNWEANLTIAPQISFRATASESKRGNRVSLLLKGATPSGGIRVTPGLAFDGTSSPNLEAMREAQVLQPGFSLMGNSVSQNASLSTTVLSELLAELKKRQAENREKLIKMEAEFLGRFAAEVGTVSRESEVAKLPQKIQEKLLARGLDRNAKLKDCRIVLSLNFRVKNPDGTFTNVSFTPFMAL